MPRGIYTHKVENLTRQIEAMAEVNRGKTRCPVIKTKISIGLKTAYREGRLVVPSREGTHWCIDSKQRWSEKQQGSGAAWWGRHHSIETRRKLSAIQKARYPSSDCRTVEIEELRHTVEFKIWREYVFKRDNWTCQKCGKRGGRLHPHHIKSFTRYPELRFDIGNGITLCEICHLNTDNYGGRARQDGYVERRKFE